jgi:hypothetical protein
VNASGDSRFAPVDLSGVFNADVRALPRVFSREVAGTAGGLTARLDAYIDSVPTGRASFRGIPFVLGGREQQANNVLLLSGSSIEIRLGDEVSRSGYFVFAHSSFMEEPPIQPDGMWQRTHDGQPSLREAVARYTLLYKDGSSHTTEIRRGRQINEFHMLHGSTTTEAVPHYGEEAVPTAGESIARAELPAAGWGWTQTRVRMPPANRYIVWLYALENPLGERAIKAIRLSPVPHQSVLISGLTACRLSSHPLRWDRRGRAILTVPASVQPMPYGEKRNLSIDMGAVIAITPLQRNDNGQLKAAPDTGDSTASARYIVEYTCHPDALISLPAGSGSEQMPVRTLSSQDSAPLVVLPSASRPVRVAVADEKGAPIPVRIHIHDEHGQYFAPTDRCRYPNPDWFEDYGADHVYRGHASTYIRGLADYLLPLGEVFIEVSRGFEFTPIRKSLTIDRKTDQLLLTMQRAVRWREMGWVTADTHVHFLSPGTALLEGEAEGVNVVNLLAAQWGEMFTNVGDFDGRTTFAQLSDAEHAGPEHIVRVGTENRQHVLGHISLLGYEGRMILPLSTSGPIESALGEPLQESMTSWARRCRAQSGIVILPHFPGPRAEDAAVIVLGLADGVEMACWQFSAAGLSPYSLSDWYRFLGCSYHVAIVGGTDKMCAETAIGAMRTYAKTKAGSPVSLESWKDAVRSGNTFVTVGPVLELAVEGREIGSTISLPAAGGLIEVSWHVASVISPVSRVEVIANGAVIETTETGGVLGEWRGRCHTRIRESSWIALRVRGGPLDSREVILAHSSAIMVLVGGQLCFNAEDATSILSQIEDTIAFVETLATRNDDETTQRLAADMLAARRSLHDRITKGGSRATD